MVERFNRTMKTRMYKYFTANNTIRYVDVLPELISGYNNTVHSSINMAPANVLRPIDAIKVRQKLYGKPSVVKNTGNFFSAFISHRFYPGISTKTVDTCQQKKYCYHYIAQYSTYHIDR